MLTIARGYASARTGSKLSATLTAWTSLPDSTNSGEELHPGPDRDLWDSCED